MNYCSACGSKDLKWTVPTGDHRRRYQCTHCHTVHYENPNMVVGCVIEHDGKILLARRGIEPRKGYWNLPCGFLENDETVQEGALREVLEETGMTVDLGNLLTVYNVVNARQVYLIFRAKAQNEQFTLTPESTEIAFFNPAEIPWDEMAFSANVHAIQVFLDSDDDQMVHLNTRQ